MIVRECAPETFARLFGGKFSAAQIAAGGFWLFEVVLQNARAGGFLVKPGPTGAELHTELKVTGLDALLAFRELCRHLRDRYGVSRLTTYTPHDNRKANCAARRAGFRAVAADERGTHFELWLPTFQRPT